MTFLPTLTNVSASTIFMTEYFSDMEMMGVPVGFQSMFGRTENGSKNDFVYDSLQFSVDIVRGNKLASIALPRTTYAGWDLGAMTSSSKGEKFRNITRFFPLIQEYIHIGFSELFNRVPGENPIAEISSDQRLIQRLRYRFADDMMAAIKRIIRKRELMARESILSSTITLDDTAASQYDFERSAGITFAAGTIWTNAAATPIVDIDTICNRVHDRSGREPNFCIQASDTFAAFTARITTIADNRGFMFVRAGQNSVLPALASDLQFMVDAGFKYVGWLQTYKGRQLPILTYNERYESSAGVYADILTAGTCVVGNSMARNDLVHGPRITFPNNPYHEQALNALLGFDFTSAPMPQNMDAPGVFDIRQFHIDGRVNDDNDAIAARIISGPIYCNTECDAFGTITACA